MSKLPTISRGFFVSDLPQKYRMYVKIFWLLYVPADFVLLLEKAENKRKIAINKWLSLN